MEFGPVTDKIVEQLRTLNLSIFPGASKINCIYTYAFTTVLCTVLTTVYAFTTIFSLSTIQRQVLQRSSFFRKFHQVRYNRDPPASFAMQNINFILAWQRTIQQTFWLARYAAGWKRKVIGMPGFISWLLVFWRLIEAAGSEQSYWPQLWTKQIKMLALKMFISTCRHQTEMHWTSISGSVSSNGRRFATIINESNRQTVM